MRKRGAPSSSNWEKLREKIQVSSTSKKHKVNEDTNSSKFKRESIKSKIHELPAELENDLGEVSDAVKELLYSQRNIPDKVRSRYVGLDCEMVGIGSSGKKSVLARVSMVNFDGKTILDLFVRPSEFVTDFRTEFSGIRKRDLRHGHAISLKDCQQQVSNALSGKIVVGHALNNDFKVLMLSHPHTRVRDTARYKPYMRVSDHMFYVLFHGR
jgi:hypothetical protein